MVLWFYHILFIHSQNDGSLGCFHFFFWLSWIKLLGNWVVHVFVWLPVFSYLGYMPGVELLDYMVILCLHFWGTAELFSAAVPFCIPTNKVGGFQFLHILVNTCYFPSSFFIAFSVNVVSHCGFNLHFPND